MKKLLFACIFVLMICQVHAQTYIMNGTAITDCSGSFFDPGGGNGNYPNNQNLSTTICSDATAGTHIRLDFTGVSLGDGDQLCFYDGTSAAANQLSCSDEYPSGPFVVQATAANTSGCLTVVFISDATGNEAGWSAAISCVASCQQIQAEIVSTNPAVFPVDTGWIDVCPGERIIFNGQGVYPQNGLVYAQSDFTTSFEWSFGDGDIAYGPSVSHRFDNPGGYYVQLFLTDAQGCHSTNLINQRIRVAPRPNFQPLAGYDNVICAGDSIHLQAVVNTSPTNQNVEITPGVEGFSIDGSRSDSLALPDGTGIPYETTLYFTEFSPGQVLTSISDLEGIFVNMEHSWARDIEIDLTCPNGTTVILHDHPGNFGSQVFLGIPNDSDNFAPVPGSGFDYWWRPTATNPTFLQYANTILGGAGTIPAGSYSSFDPLTDFIGCPLNGQWTLRSTDYWPADNGYIFSWGIDFNDLLYPDVETFSPALVNWQWSNHPSIYQSNPLEIFASPENAGSANYVFTVNDEFGCAWDTMLNVTILPYTHPECFSCPPPPTPLGDTSVCLGQPVTLDATLNHNPLSEVRFETAPDYRFGNANHNHLNPYESAINISSLGYSILTNPIAQINSICMDIETDFDADLNILLESPDGKILMLSTGNGGSGDNYKVTCFSPSAVTPIVGQAAPFNGTYRPEGAWSDLNNAVINGDWKLLVSDGFGVNQYGRVKSWDIAFNLPNTVTYNWQNAATLSCTNCPTPVATPSNSTDYIVTTDPGFGCVFQDTIRVDINAFFAAPDNLTMTGMGGGVMNWSWSPVAGVTLYEININGAGWQQVSGTTYSVSGLMPGDMVNLEIRCVGGSVDCPPTIASAQQTYADCTLTATVAFTLPVTCPGGSDGAVNVTVSGGQGQVVFYSDGGTVPYTTGNLTFYMAGPHYVEAVDAMGCRDTVYFNITEPNHFVVNTTATNALCFGTNTGTANAMATGGTGTLTYQWQNCTGGPVSFGVSAINLFAGCYRVTITDMVGCSVTATQTVGQNPPFAFTTAQDSVNCFGGADGSATVNVSGATPPYDYLWTNGDMTATADMLPAGFHSVTITDDAGCQAVTLVQVLQPSALVIDSIRIRNVSCFGLSDGEAQVYVHGGVSPPYTYQWTPGGGSTALLPNIGGGIYTVTVTDRNGCQVTDQDVVIEPAAITITQNALSNESCANSCNGAISITASGGSGALSAVWNNPVIPSGSLNPTGLCAGNYTVTITDARGCSQSATYTINAATNIQLNLTSNAPLCAGMANGSATVSVTGAATPLSYQWSNGQTTATASGLTCNTFTVTVTDANLCTQQQSVTLNCPDAILIDDIDIQTVRCFGESNGGVEITASGGTGTLSYIWNDPNQQIGSSITDLPAGPYAVTITDDNGCTLVAAATVPQPALLTAPATASPANCFGQASGATTVNPTGGSGPYQFIWSHGATTAQAGNIQAGSYTVTVTDQNGCTAISNAVMVNQPATPVSVQVSQIQVACHDENDGVALAAASGGTGPNYTYQWDNGFLGDINNNLALGNYTVTATDANGCTGTATVNILEHAPITAGVILVNPGCFGYSDGQVTVNTVGGGAGNGQISEYTYQWSLPGGPSGIYVNNVPGDTPFQLTVTDNQGCSAVFDYNLTQPQQIQLQLAPQHVSCFGFSDGSIVVSGVQGDNPIVTYQWNNAGSGQQINNLPAGTYQVTATDTDGCTGAAFVAITQPTALQIELGVTPVLCSGDSNAVIMATAAGGVPDYSFNWSNGANGATVDHLPAGHYIVTLTDENGCILIDSTDVAQPQAPQIDVTITDASCFGLSDGQITLSVGGSDGPYSYAVSPNDFTGSPRLIGLSAGDYLWLVRDGNGCIFSDSITVGQPLAIEVDLGPDITLTFGDSTTLLATASYAVGNVTFEWNPYIVQDFMCVDTPECASITLMPFISNTIQVTATDEEGCEGVAIIHIDVDLPRGIFVPTGFTPNGDNNNEILSVLGKSKMVKRVLHFRIFDRWGEMVYEDLNFDVNEITRGWDGNFRGQNCQAGVYVWTLSAEYLDGQVVDLYGETTLIR